MLNEVDNGMGYKSDVRLITKKENNAFKICTAKDTNHDDNIESTTIEYLFNCLISENINDVCIDVSKITDLELSMCDLTDIPIAFKKLNLKHLDLSHNKLENVPLCLYSGLKFLESLDLSYNSIRNFDMEPDCLLYVRKMKLNNNKLQNIPKWFLMFRCTNMVEFNYSENEAKHYRFTKNSFNINLVKLRKLELISSCLIDDDISFLKCFKQLQYLDISNGKMTHMNKFDDLDKLFVKPKWKELEVIKLNSLSISLFPEGTAWIASLKEVHVTHNCLSWLPEDIKYLVNLEILNASDNSLVCLPKSLLSLQKLRELLVSNNSIDDLPDFSLMPNLKVLDVYRNILETVPDLNFDTIECIDIEYNYCNTTNLLQFTIYNEKKNKLRNKYSFKERIDGVKASKPENLRYSSSSSTDECESIIEGTNLASINFSEEENWDLPTSNRKTVLDIDSEDDKWEGVEYNATHKKKVSERERIYISDDDLLFVDCEES